MSGLTIHWSFLVRAYGSDRVKLQIAAVHEFGVGTKRTCLVCLTMFVLGSKADIVTTGADASERSTQY
jgi:hypothetical protein